MVPPCSSVSLTGATDPDRAGVPTCDSSRPSTRLPSARTGWSLLAGGSCRSCAAACSRAKFGGERNSVGAECSRAGAVSSTEFCAIGCTAFAGGPRIASRAAADTGENDSSRAAFGARVAVVAGGWGCASPAATSADFAARNASRRFWRSARIRSRSHVLHACWRPSRLPKLRSKLSSGCGAPLNAQPERRQTFIGHTREGSFPPRRR